MPVIATPVSSSSSGGGAQGSAQLTVAPAVTSVEGTPVPAKMQAVVVKQHHLTTVTWTMRAQNGAVVDLTTLAGATVELHVREAMSMSTSNPGVTIAGVVVNAAAGVVQATLTLPAVQCNGISYAEFVFVLNDAYVLSNNFFLIVEPSQAAGSDVRDQGPLTIGELRLALRDVDPAGNLWVASFEFDLAEIAACIVRPIRQFNEAAPPLEQTFTTASFPWRENWLKASCGYMLRIAADWYRRVHLPYGGLGGITTDDKNKFREYDERGRELLEEWKEFVRIKKVQLNMEAGYGIFGSVYDSRWRNR